MRHGPEIRLEVAGRCAYNTMAVVGTDLDPKYEKPEKKSKEGH